jgi:hypothetical protein
MTTKMFKAIVQDDRHIETRQAIKGVKRGQEIEVFIHIMDGLQRGDKVFSFSDHDFGKWRGGQMRREEIYHENGR